MKKVSLGETLSIGLAIFSMFFGAGNLILPLKVGLQSGTNLPWAMLAFIVSGILVPLVSLVSIILFEGDYKAFFKRLGTIPGEIGIVFCLLIVGPLLVMPRIINFSHAVMAPFLGNISLLIFTGIFLLLTFIATYKEGKILGLLGNIVSPVLLGSLGLIIIKGIVTSKNHLLPTLAPVSTTFCHAFTMGYGTLDAIGSIFFCAMVIGLLRQNAARKNINLTPTESGLIGLKAGAFGLSLLAVIYVGLGYLGGLEGIGLEGLDPAQLFSAVSFKVLGSSGAIIIAVAIFMACYSTLVPLTTIFSTYLQQNIPAINHLTSLLITLGITGLTASVGLTNLMKWSMPFIEIMYPALITLSIVNIAYKVLELQTR